MSIDLSEFDAIRPPRVKGCTLGILTKEQHEKVIAARAKGYEWKTIIEVMKGWGVKASDSTLRRHVNGVCTCTHG